MSEGEDRRLGCMTWVVFLLGLPAVLANLFYIQFIRWADAYRAPEGWSEGAWPLWGLGVVLVVLGLGIWAMATRRRWLAIGTSVVQAAPTLMLAIGLIVRPA